MIDFLQTWWPPDSKRIEDYTRRQQLFESEHCKAFSEKSAKVPEHLEHKLYLVQDYPKLISTTFADLLFGQAPIFSLPSNQDQLNKLVADNRLNTSLYESELSASFRGDAVFKVSIAPRHPGGKNEVLIEEVPAYAYFVEVDPDNQRRVLSQCLAWERIVCQGEKEIRYLRVEHHLPGQIVNELFVIEGWTKVRFKVPLSDLYGESAPPDVQLTKVDVPLLFHFPNLRHGSAYYGMSDYTDGLETLFDEANQRITGIANVLDRHGDPKLMVPEGIVSKRGTVKATDLEVFVLQGPEKPEYLTWDAKLDSFFRQLEGVEEKIFQFSDVSPAMFGKDKAGNIESGRAMMMRFARMITRAVRKQNYREPVICEMLYTALMLGAANGVEGYTMPEAKPEMVWRNGLPKDDKELTEVAAAAVQAGFMSKLTAIRYTRQVGDQEAAAELERIESEAPPEPPPPLPNLPPAPPDPAPTQVSGA